MGSGSKFEIGLFRGIGLAVFVDTFPHALSIRVIIACISIYIGIGKGYDE